MDDARTGARHDQSSRTTPRDRLVARAGVATTIAGLHPVVTQSSDGLTLVVLGRRGTRATPRLVEGSRPGARSGRAPIPTTSIAARDALTTGSGYDAGTDADADPTAVVSAAFVLPPGAVGVAVGIFDRIVSLDAFDDPEALREAWPRLVARAVAAWLDRRLAIGSGASPLPGRRVPDDGATGRLLRRASVALEEADVRSTDGDHLDVRIAGERVRGVARVSDGRAVRLALLPRDTPDPLDGLVP